MIRNRSIVMGAGIQGVLIALMLANRGQKVVLVDRRSSVMSGASLNFEGRIHLGLIYAMDRSFATSERMIQDSLHFAKGIEKYSGTCVNWDSLKSTRSTYVVHRDSLLSLDELETHFNKVEERFLEVSDELELNYLGAKPSHITRRCPVPDQVSSDIVTAAFDTAESCLDQASISRLLHYSVNSNPNIEVQLNCEITEIKEGQSGSWTVNCKTAKQDKFQIAGESVFNCLWEARGLFDASIGLDIKRNETMRLKYGVMVQRNDVLDQTGSLVIVHGAFGTIVKHDYSPSVFLSWYPACIKGILPLQPLPSDWAAAISGSVGREKLFEIAKANLEGFKEILPDIGDPLPTWAGAGVILAEGTRDIDLANSDFHRRDEPAIASKGTYYSVSTSKFTSAPRNTMLLEKMVFPD